MDPLSDVPSLLKPRSYMCGGFDAGGKWSLRFPQHDGIRFYAVVSGECRLSVEGVPDTVRVRAAVTPLPRISTHWSPPHGCHLRPKR
jgi:hypothetical protein